VYKRLLKQYSYYYRKYSNGFKLNVIVYYSNQKILLNLVGDDGLLKDQLNAMFIEDLGLPFLDVVKFNKLRSLTLKNAVDDILKKLGGN
jgi:hypothetical protein